ncbi:MAG: hypothetical protein ABSE49_27000 [Polyangiaceae bacterium]
MRNVDERRTPKPRGDMNHGVGMYVIVGPLGSGLLGPGGVSSP